jgi:hypothetical protein
MIGLEEAANLSDVPNVRQKGTRLGNWLTREQAKESLAVPDRSTLKGKRDYVIIALLVGCALRRRELASITIEDIQLRDLGQHCLHHSIAAGSAYLRLGNGFAQKREVLDSDLHRRLFNYRPDGPVTQFSPRYRVTPWL